MPAIRRTIVITGAGGALGAAIARQLGGEPDTNLLLSDLDASALAVSLDTLTNTTAVIETVTADVSDLPEVQAVVNRAVERFGRIDVLISNAGILTGNGRIHNLSTADWNRAIQVNLLGAVNNLRAAIPIMRQQHGGSIVLTASVAGMTGWTHAAPYCATKAAIIELAKVAAVEYASDGIRVNCVCPGAFPSAIHAGLPDTGMAALAARHPLGLGCADDLVGAYSYLASPHARWTTGTAIVVDGGYTAL